MVRLPSGATASHLQLVIKRSLGHFYMKNLKRQISDRNGVFYDKRMRRE